MKTLFYPWLVLGFCLLIFSTISFGQSHAPSKEYQKTEFHAPTTKTAFDYYLEELNLKVPDPDKDHKFLIMSQRSCPGCNLAADYHTLDRSKENITTILVYSKYQVGVPGIFKEVVVCNPDVTVDHENLLSQYDFEIKTDGLVTYDASSKTFTHIPYSAEQRAHEKFYELVGMAP